MGPRLRRSPLLPISLAALALAILASAASAAAAPSVTTSPATNIGPQGATLNGVVNPNGRATEVRFQWGRTTNYANSTPKQQVGAGTTPVPVAADLAKLRSNTTYHFRVVATSSAGTDRGADRTFKTAKPTTTPNFSPNPGTFARPVTIYGTLVGTGAARANVTLLSRPFPFTAPFAQVGNTVISDAGGRYSFTIGAVMQTSQFQVKASTNPPTTSEIATLTVNSQITFHTRTRVRKGRALLFAGSVAPPQDGLQVLIQKRSRTGVFRTVAHTTLRHLNATRSAYSRRIRARRSGTYRTVVQSAGGAVSPGISTAKSIRVLR
jgi:hypothetical protein